MKKKSIVTLIIFCIALFMGTAVYAAPSSFMWNSDGHGEIATIIVDNFWIMCIEKGGHLRHTQYYGDDAGREKGEYCSGEEHRSAEWDGTKNQTKFILQEAVDNSKYQDAAYALVNSGDIDRAQRLIWAMDINKGRYVATSDDLYKESVVYRGFYEKVQAAGGYKPVDTTDTANVKVSANQTDKTYKVGPFKVSYLGDYYYREDGTRINFGEIVELNVLNENGTRLQLVDLLDVRGSSILQRDYKYPTSNEEFYVVFKGIPNTSAGKNIKLELKFNYLKECTGTIVKYKGEISEWYWTRSSWSHFHKTGHCNGRDSNGNKTHAPHDTGYSDEHYKYTLKKSYVSTAQEMIGYGNDGRMVWDNVTMYLGQKEPKTGGSDKPGKPDEPTPGIDITMNLSGTVFLDKDEGKVNEGNNKSDSGEGLAGVEVTLYEVGSDKVILERYITHQHTGNSSTKGGCYTTPVYHQHSGNENVYGECYTELTHTHIGSSSQGGPGTCFATPIYHQHDEDCYDANGQFICTKSTNTIEFYKQTCTQEVKYKQTCGKQEGKTIEYYTPSCGKSTSTIIGKETLKNPVLTDEQGHYEFVGLDAQKRYYVKFTYNGMLYTNVLYNRTGDDTSKATEEGQGHSNNRKDFNSVFSEIGSYPANYKVKNDIFGLGYNRTYLQEEVADIFIEVAKKVVELNGDELAAYRAVAGNDKEKQRKVQFVADCRINAYTVETYPLTEEFVIDKSPQILAGKGYLPIYGATYNQTNVNLGIKARPTFDMALYKDVFNAVVEINGKSETYEYDERRDTEHKGFSVGVNESDYLNQLREKYLNGKDTNLKTKEVQASKEYTQELRSEEIINGNNANTNINPDTLYDNDNNYAWRDMNYQLSQQDKMKIHVTYKLSVKNQSGVKGSVTELVDYYDNHYNFEGAYVGDENGNKIEGTNVEVSDTSMYANRNATQSPSNTMYGTDGKYKTIYLRPSEQKLGSSEEQYIYVTFGLIDPENTLVNAKLMDGEKLYTYNLAEINGYRTYSEGLVDRDSNPGNFNVAEYQRGVTALEDDENQAPAFIYSKRYSRTVEGTVFEDTITSPKNANELATKQARFGSATIDEKDTPIKDVIVELVEIKQVGDQKQLIVRQATRTDEKGWYGFGALLPGDYVIRYTYGSDNQTAMTTTTPNIKGSNATSYNGQDYQATTYHTKDQEATSVENYGVDDILTQRYTINNKNKNTEEKTLTVEGQKITKYTNNGYYWYNDSAMVNRSDAYDDSARKNQVIDYSKNEYGREIVNHKAEVFNSYENPQPEHITKELHAKLVSELERRTYRYAYTAEMPVEIEYTTKTINGNQNSNHYTYKITGVDFGVVQRPKAKLELTKNIEHIKVTAADGTVLFDTNKGVNNLSWTVRKDRYKKVPVTQIIMDDELISGAKLEITYKFTVTNTSEIDENGNSTTRAKKIIDYVANNLTYTKEDGNNNLWQIVNKDDIQNEKNSTLINNTQNGKYKLIDLSTKQTILQTTESNPLTKALKAGESAEATLVLKKVLSAESSTDDLTYRNIAEIVEVDNTVGRYDHTSVPGNQLPDAEPTEDDTFEAETIVVLPPFGSQPVYYVIGIIAAVILAGGIYLIKKKVIDNR